MDSIQKILRRLAGKKLQNRREQMGFETQKDLAQEIGIDPSKVSRWETGDYFPGKKHWNKIVDILELTEEYFVGDTRPQATNAELLKMIEDRDKQIKELESQLGLVKRIPIELLKFLAKETKVSKALVLIISGRYRPLRESFAKVIDLASRSASSDDKD